MMKIILTHEQSDFDAIASLLGAYLIDEAATPILPRRINRNVSAFITLYGSELPFVNPRDFNGKPIETVYLVDTQSIVSIKGLSPQTQVHVVDHHPKRKNLPAHWDVRITQTGANTTLFVEEIQARGIQLSMIQATLLLLGIYEDTGSLTYSRTTSRDIRAAADLVDKGANLAILPEYLNHPLSREQQAIFEALRTAAQHHLVLGHDILIAAGDASNFDEELSTIAHKLRDLLVPDAIFLIIAIRGGIQIIARSTNDKIDVAKICNHFGGGGHPRAAAALVKLQTIADVQAALIQKLPVLVEPALTVADLMSREPQLVSKNTTAQEILHQMQRYGYEGYPVVEKNRVIGLVTRRAVDRAIAHNLNLRAEDLMDAGTHTIHPENPIEILQTIMTQSGWGQIPVVDSETQKIIGIVTRTDLLKTLAPTAPQKGKRNLAQKLENSLLPDRLNLLKEIAKIAQDQGLALYIVGGFVRDLLMDHPSQDFDLVVEGDAIQLAQRVLQVFGGRVTTHQRFGTAKWFLSDPHNPLKIDRTQLPQTLDFITARREFYTHPTALPTIERGSIKLDLHRRDFTINTLALRLDGNRFGELLDYWGGVHDIQAGLVRVLHSISFVDDPTRTLRAVRYEQRYGFQIGNRTLELLIQARPLMDRVSGDRIRHEINNIFNEECLTKIMDRLLELKLLEAIHPAIIWNNQLKRIFQNLVLPPPEWGIDHNAKGMPLKQTLAYILWLLPVPEEHTKAIIKRLKLARLLKESVLAGCRLWADLESRTYARPSEYAERLQKVPPLSIYAVFLTTKKPTDQKALYQFIQSWGALRPKTTGEDLRALGLQPGPQYAQILGLLKAAWIDGEIQNKQEERDHLQRLLQNDTHH